MQCLQDQGGGVYQLITPAPVQYTSCAYILVQPTELQAQLFNLTVDEGAQLSAAIAVLWALAYGARMGIRALNVNEKENES